MENRNFHISVFCKLISLACLLLFSSLPLLCQQTEEVKKIEGADAVREEIQRYMGYEPIAPRYLTLPYDATTNANVFGPFVDIGFLFLALIPVIFLFGFKRKPLYGIICMILLSGFLYISIGSGKIFVKNNFTNTINFVSYEGNGDFNKLPNSIIQPVYKWVNASYKSVHQFFNTQSGNADGFTYPLLFLSLLLFVFLIRERTFNQDGNRRILILFTVFFTFMWMLLTAGIIWYGYPMIAMSLLLILSSIEPKKEADQLPKKIIRGIGLIAVVSFILLSLNYRISNYKMNMNGEMAKQLIDIGELKYQSGRLTKSEVLDGFFRGGINETLAKINNDEKALVYRVGTVLPFYVKKNDSRVFMDNQLQNFDRLRTHFKDKNTLIEVLKSAGYKYIFVDLKTYTIDKTPEQTLVNKYKEFMRVLYQNPKVSLLATDRRVNTSDDPQKPTPEYAVFGAPLPNYHGTYAIFELTD